MRRWFWVLLERPGRKVMIAVRAADKKEATMAALSPYRRGLGYEARAVF